MKTTLTDVRSLTSNTGIIRYEPTQTSTDPQQAPTTSSPTPAEPAVETVFVFLAGSTKSMTIEYRPADVKRREELRQLNRALSR